jgi:hypothetical protein
VRCKGGGRQPAGRADGGGERLPQLANGGVEGGGRGSQNLECALPHCGWFVWT